MILQTVKKQFIQILVNNFGIHNFTKNQKTLTISNKPI